MQRLSPIPIFIMIVKLTMNNLCPLSFLIFEFLPQAIVVIAGYLDL